ncbi:hypothetical protein JQ615_35705 [Bradyrhizobium jicamae]|uniref:Uncharacterized protein n=1 Tax=Bradyrhizobium jicamae TaxID=280332 RepID=A0ABS5FV57_9BRAD|nr:hypothetical protein [Bradyrhizobium jicamae]MBR0800721.1 hypothetical protein [Bradyrhizobium jicamae]
MTPWEYASRYLPVQVPRSQGLAEIYPIDISHYHLGAPTAAKDQILGAMSDHFASNQRKNASYRLTLRVNGLPVEFASRDELIPSLNAFWGKGTPEDCQIVLHLALTLGGIKPNQLQSWADTNLGLDCNGFVGNYLFHEVQQNGWQQAPGKTEIGPSTTIDEYFKRWVQDPILDLSHVIPGRMHLIVRVDDNGLVIPRCSGGKVGHIAITQPGESMNQSFVTDTMGFYDKETADLGMYNKFALRTVESGGPVKGVQKNWMVFVQPYKVKGVFEVRRDHIHMLDKVRIAPLRAGPG